MATRAPAEGGGLLQVLTLSGRLPVRICRLCAALILASGEQRHQDQHTADARRADR